MLPAYVARRHPVANTLTAQQEGIVCLAVHEDQLCNNSTRAAICDWCCQLRGTGCHRTGKSIGWPFLSEVNLDWIWEAFLQSQPEMNWTKAGMMLVLWEQSSMRFLTKFIYYKT